LHKLQRGLVRGSDLDAFLVDLLRVIHNVLAQEERQLGLRIRLDPPWALPDRELSELLEGDPKTAAEIAAGCGQYVGFDPLPDFFAGEAPARIEFLQAVLQGISQGRVESDDAN
jgi:hypothetical protein